MNVAAFCPVDHEDWENYHLTKDCGLIPYILHKNYGMNVSMVGTSDNIEDYPSRDLVPGLKFVPLHDADLNRKMEYIINHIAEIDILLLYGAYSSNMAMATIYKELRHDGLVYVSLDINSGWLAKIDTETELFKSFLENVDIMSASGSDMAKYLTYKWGREIIYISNGFINLIGDSYITRKFKDKENIILTVGRLGTNQKATDVLLKGFALSAHILDGWKLKLIGSVEEDFKSYINDYFEEYPGLSDRVIFTGPISDKKVLADEYEKSKIFALTSRWEGGHQM